MTNGTLPIVAGIDGSPDALTAVAWAAEEASRRGALQVVYANMWPMIRGHWPADYADQLLLRGEELVQEAIREARHAAPGLSVTGTVITGHPAPVLIERSRAAQLVVVGSRGLGGFTGLLVGSTSVALAGHAACPVVVVRYGEPGPGPRTGPVVVGIGADERGQLADVDAVRFALAAAAARDTAMTAVHTVTDVSATDLWGLLRSEGDQEMILSQARERVEKLLSPPRADHPGVPVEVLVGAARPAAVLVELSGSAQLVVVGCRGRGGFAGLLLGSVSQALLHHAGCPLAILRRA